MSLEDAASNAANMLQAGFETVSLTLSYCFFRVAKHQEIQDNMRQEVISVLSKHGELNYEAISELQYTSQVLSETLRVHGPVTAFTSRMTNQDYKVPKMCFFAGVFSVIACSHLVHKDPNLWPETGQRLIQKGSLRSRAAPATHSVSRRIGMGPRICVGSQARPTTRWRWCWPRYCSTSAWSSDSGEYLKADWKLRATPSWEPHETESGSSYTNSNNPFPNVADRAFPDADCASCLSCPQLKIAVAPFEPDPGD
uniref:Putative cytochrome n=1 Tax=Ixodes ricinus TaxID=34613 RepID=A0A090XF82_IXORI